MQAMFSLGFALAIFYHVCHMHVDGLQGAALFGISGPLWRTLDIVCAQWLLARTFGHVVGARHWLTQGDCSVFASLKPLSSAFFGTLPLAQDSDSFPSSLTCPECHNHKPGSIVGVWMCLVQVPVLHYGTVV